MRAQNEGSVCLIKNSGIGRKKELPFYSLNNAPRMKKYRNESGRIDRVPSATAVLTIIIYDDFRGFVLGCVNNDVCNTERNTYVYLK